MWTFRSFRTLKRYSSATYTKYQTIAECYDGQSVFMTGGTGFLGKVILEKLLYSCPGIDKVYLLVREKRGATTGQRIQTILEQPLFSRLKNEKPETLQKIIPIAGDISHPQLGMKTEDEELLTNKISTVLHVAATVKFNKPLKEAMNINVTGTERILNLSKRMKNVKAFLYVSTAYANVNRTLIDDIVYPAPASLSDVKKILDIDISDKRVKKLMQGRPNTYTFTKALAENLVADNHGSVPSVIVRPSIVCCTQREPIVGWIDNWYGASPFIATIMKGENRIILAKPDNVLDLIPVDYVSNLIIVAAARCKSSKYMDVYNITTSGENPISYKQLIDLAITDSHKHKFYNSSMPMLFYTRFKWLKILMTILLQTLPALIADTILIMSGKRTRHLKLQAKAVLVRDTVEYFTINEWVLPAKRTRALSESLSPSDRYSFECDPSNIEWKEYITTYCQGIRRYLHKT